MLFSASYCRNKFILLHISFSCVNIFCLIGGTILRNISEEMIIFLDCILFASDCLPTHVTKKKYLILIIYIHQYGSHHRYLWNMLEKNTFLILNLIFCSSAVKFFRSYQKWKYIVLSVLTRGCQSKNLLWN